MKVYEVLHIDELYYYIYLFDYGHMKIPVDEYESFKKDKLEK